MSKLVQKVFLICLFVISLSVGIDAMYRHVYHIRYQWPKNIFILPENKDKYEIVKVGNSHAENGIDFERYNLKSLSLASAGQTLDYDLAYLKMYSRQIKEGAIIIITASPISFSQGKPSREDALQTQYYDGRISPFLIPNIKVEDYLQSQIFPFLRAGYSWRQNYNDEIKARISKEEKWTEPAPTATAVSGKPTPVANAETTDQYIPANYADKTYFFHVQAIEHELTYPSTAPDGMLVESMNAIFNKWYHTSGFGTQFFEANRKDLERLIAYRKEKKWRPVVITIPLSKVLLDGLLPDYMQVYIYDNISKTNLQGVEYFNFATDERLTKNKYLFGSADHLNPKGAVIFSYLLLQRLIDKGYVPKNADGYDYTWSGNAMF